MPPKILVVDDEYAVRELVRAYLEREGYQVETAADGPTGLRAARTLQPDVLVLDIMLPGLDGLDLLAQLRRESNAYVILLTARAEETDVVVGLSLGADDYVTKPFSPRELVARVKAALRRLNASDEVEPALTFQGLRIDRDARQVWVADALVELTPTEFDLLLALAENAGRVLTRAQLIQRVWGHDFYGEERVVDVHIGNLRQKLAPAQPIATVRGVGYRFEGDAA
ncbi:MAG: response regulator transcription factor [Anaerolineae bacterium]|nr:response regulator transcription factor [Anaerolineae bacterium]